jgi:hypothetical protein
MAEPTGRKRTTNGRAPLAQLMAGAQTAGQQLMAGAERMPDLLATTGTQLHQAQQGLERWSDRSLAAGASFSLGFAAGLFVAGSPRALVLLAVAPGAAMLATLLGRAQTIANTQPRQSARQPASAG